jgi:hypothetical protein
MPRRKGKGIGAYLGDEETPGKATFYLPPKLLLELDDVWLELRRENRKLRKSDIVAWTLSQALKLYQEKGKESELYRALVPKEEAWPETL